MSAGGEFHGRANEAFIPRAAAAFLSSRLVLVECVCFASSSFLFLLLSRVYEEERLCLAKKDD